MDAERDVFSETAFAHLGWDITRLKHRQLSVAHLDVLRRGLARFPPALQQLVLLVPEKPRSRESLSRMDVVGLLVAGMGEFEECWFDRFKTELAAVDFMGREFFNTLSNQDSLGELSHRFEKECPQLQKLFLELVIGEHTADNKLRTVEVKLEWTLILASAIGKVRNKNRVGFASTLYTLWRSLGVPEDAINVLASLGLSLSSKDGAKKTRRQVEAQRGSLAAILRKPNAVMDSCIVFDNIDISLSSRSFNKDEVNVRHRLVHVTAASVMYFRECSRALVLLPMPRPALVPVTALFASPECQARLISRVACVLHHTLHAYKTVVICGRHEAPAPWVDYGSLTQTRRQALPVFWLEEGKIDHMYEFAKDVCGRYSTKSRPASRLHFVGDCFSLQKLIAVRELVAGEGLGTARCDFEDFSMILVPGWFHLYWNVFLGSVLQSDRDLLQLMVEVAGLKNVKLHSDIGSCFNDMDHLVTFIFPVAVVRLFRYFAEHVAPGLGIKVEAMAETEVMMHFSLFVSHTVAELQCNVEVLEWQRLCRLVLCSLCTDLCASQLQQRITSR